MKNIADLIETIADETGIVPRLSVLLITDADAVGPSGTTAWDEPFWVARVHEDGMTLLDREGERFLSCKAETLEDALAGLDRLCA